MTEEKGAHTSFDANRSCEALSLFIKRLKNDICQCLNTATGQISGSLQHCETKCNSLVQTLQATAFSEIRMAELLQKTAHLVLDYTYVDETVLVDEEFPQDTCMTRIYNIRELLNEVCEVALQCKPFQTLLEILGTELVECIHWRKGALLYMYCHTLQSQDRLKQELAQYKKCLEDGVHFLEDMLKIRQPSSSYQPAPDDTMQLLNQGIFSDTHLLAMIYAGEMCYWYSCAQDRGLFHQDDQSGDSFTARHQGLKHLNSYLCAVKGPLKTLNWNTEKAEDYVKYLSRGLQQ